MTFLLAHLSDPHIGPLPRIPLLKLLNKRLTGALNWHKARANIHNMDVLATLLADIVAQNPDHVALTGDLVNLGYAPEFPQAHAMTRILGDAAGVSIVPGNHDAYIGESLPAMHRIFAPYMRGDADPEAHFPYLRRRGGLALIGVNSGAPTLPFMATGRLGRAQRDKLKILLDATRRQGLFRVVMIHHPPLIGSAKFGRGLTDARALTRVLVEHGAELVLHGHNHRHSLAILPARAGDIPILGVASASAVPGTPHHRAEYHLIEIEPETRRLRIHRRGLADDGHRIAELGSFTFPQGNS